MGPRYKGTVSNVGRVVEDNRKSRVLKWRKDEHFGQAATPAEGRVSSQGGGIMPYIVAKSALEAYYDSL
jgi:hypothetical protein